VPFDSSTFLPVARKLDTATGSEADLRTAYGRAYYAAYLVARERLSALGHKHARADQVGVHAWLLGKLKNANDPDVRVLGRQLRGLYDGRLLADYDIDLQNYAPGMGHIAAVRAEQWIREFRGIPDARLRGAL
jgi:hypothetical protein